MGTATMNDDYKTKLLLAALRGNDYIREFLVGRFWERYRFCNPGHYYAVMKERKKRGWHYEHPRDMYCTIDADSGDVAVFLTEAPQDALEHSMMGHHGCRWYLTTPQFVDPTDVLLLRLHDDAMKENTGMVAAQYVNLRDYVQKIRAAIPVANKALLQLVINEIRGMDLPPPVPAEKVNPSGRYMVQQYEGAQMVRDETFKDAHLAVNWRQKHYEAFKGHTFRYFIQGVHGWLEAEPITEGPWLKLKRL